MKAFPFVCLTALAAFTFAACGDSADTKTAENAAGDAKVETAANAAESGSGPYKVKSGIVESNVKMMGDQKQTIYFDDFGMKQTMVTEVEIMGHKSQSITINADGWSITYDPAKKEGTKVKVPAAQAAAAAMGGIPGLDALTDEMKAEMKYKELENRTIAGKDAKGIELEAMGMPMKVWTWEGIPLRTEISMGKEPMVTEAQTVEVNVEIPADRFEVPADVKISELGAK